jgi:DNA repair exonuclease SbcCD nuclease subunit
MKLALIGDLHLSERSPRYAHTLEMLDWVIGDASDAAGDAPLTFALLGDLCEATPSGSELASLLMRLRRMTRQHDVIVLLGNHESYDAIAPLDLFSDRVSTAWRSPLITILPGVDSHAVVLSIPYARRGRPPFDGIEHDGTIQGSMAATASEIGRIVGNVVNHYRGLAPVIVLGHCTIEGMKVRDAEFELHHATEAVVPRSAFTDVALAACGHIHSPQDVAPNIIGVGSLIRHSFAEAEDVKSYTLVSVDGGQVTWARRAVPCREMVEKHLVWDATLRAELAAADPMFFGLSTVGKEVKLVVEIREDQVATFDATVFDPIKAAAAYFVLEKRTIAVERRRAPAIAAAATLGDQFKAWTEATEQPLEPAQLERVMGKVAEVQG